MFDVTNDVYLEFSCSNIELYGDTTLCLRVEFRLLSILHKTPLSSRQIVLFNYGEIGRFAMAKIRPLYGYYTAPAEPLTCQWWTPKTEKWWPWSMEVLHFQTPWKLGDPKTDTQTMEGGGG